MAAGFAKDELLGGVTTIRTVGGLGDFDTRLRDEIESGTKMGPCILAANQGISVIVLENSCNSASVANFLNDFSSLLGC